jgi:hypothetical protein
MQEVSKGSEEATLLFLKPKGTPKSLVIRFMDSYLALVILFPISFIHRIQILIKFRLEMK